MLKSLRLFMVAIIPLITGCGLAAEITESSGIDGGVIAIRGDLETGDYEKFVQISQKYTNGAVYFESRGGDLLTGIQIGESIRLKGFDTFLPPDSTCASSCALAWLGGSHRIISSTARLGFHAAYSTDGATIRETGVGNAIVGAYLTRIGLPISAVIYITKTSPDKITWLTPLDASKVGIGFSFGESKMPSLPQVRNSTVSRSALPPLSQPSAKPEEATPSRNPEPSKITGRYYVAVNEKVIELHNFPDKCSSVKDYVSFIGKVSKTNYEKNGIGVESFVIERLNNTQEIIKVIYGLDYDFSMADLSWVSSGLQSMLRKGQEIRGVAKLCGGISRELFLEKLERQGSAPAFTLSQQSLGDRPNSELNQPLNTSMISNCPQINKSHYVATCGKVIDVQKLSQDCFNASGVEEFEGKVVQTEFSDDGITLHGFALEYTDDGVREYINIEMPADISIAEIKIVAQGLRSIIHKGKNVVGEIRRCGASGRVLVLESIRTNSPSMGGARNDIK